jgi:hypothetical protein
MVQALLTYDAGQESKWNSLLAMRAALQGGQALVEKSFLQSHST